MSFPPVLHARPLTSFPNCKRSTGVNVIIIREGVILHWSKAGPEKREVICAVHYGKSKKSKSLCSSVLDGDYLRLVPRVQSSQSEGGTLGREAARELYRTVLSL